MNNKMNLTNTIVGPLLGWYDQNKRILPWRENKEPYRIWVSEIMLQQTRVEAVKPYYERFMKTLPTIQMLANAQEDELLKLWEGLGYYNRVRNMQKAAQIMVDEFNGSFPKEFDLIMKLPGIGSYTAGAVASIAFNQRVPAVDGNVLRILARLCMYKGDVLSQKVKKETELALLEILPIERSGDFNQAMMELGATICIPNGAPKCESCPWNALCLANQNQCWSELPFKAKKKPRSIEQRTVIIIGDGKKILLHKRPKTGLLAGLYELPNIEGWLSDEQIIEKVRELGFAPIRMQKAVEAKHIFSHIEWHMKGYVVKVEPELYEMHTNQMREHYHMIERDMVERAYPIPSAFAKFTPFLDIEIGIKGKK